ncbi:potassium transporter TrkG [Halalkalibacterium ligniniphilum]|uniref:potassium transporter TrkG n=1 Tax=Halalkalibacterium ligniniphilum TaxID=1134413 RepID=UPI0003472C3E|nr:potassium transporter TrkG [Halalkalibacterium ligniniphilum]
MTTRTAGCNSIDIGGLNFSTAIFMIALMFIGAGSASTGGGIKRYYRDRLGLFKRKARNRAF